MLQRSQRLSTAVTAHTPAAFCAGVAVTSGCANMKTVGGTPLGKAWSRGGDPARDLDVDRLVGKILQLDQLQDAFAPPGHVVRVGQADAVEAALQAAQVLVEPERLFRVHRHQFVDAVAEDEAAVEHRNLRVGERQELAVEINAH